MSLLHEKVDRALSAYYLEYEKIVVEKLSGIDSLPLFFSVFNRQFPNYQTLQKWVTHPDSVRDGNVSCDVAATLGAIWWNLCFNNETASAIQNCERTSFQPHVVLGLLVSDLNAQQLETTYNLQRNSVSINDELGVYWIHWLKEGGMQPLRRLDNNRLAAPNNVTIRRRQPKQILYDAIKSYELPHSGQVYKRANV